MLNQKYVCFSGHRSLTELELINIKPLLIREIEVVLRQGVRLFYTAEAGEFDYLVLSVLNELRKSFPDINIIALHSINKRKTATKADSIIKPPKFAEAFREIIKNASCLICFANEIGGAFNLMGYAIRKKVKVTNLAESDELE